MINLIAVITYVQFTLLLAKNI